MGRRTRRRSTGDGLVSRLEKVRQVALKPLASVANRNVDCRSSLTFTLPDAKRYG